MDTVLVVDGYNAINAIPEIKKEINKDLQYVRNAIVLMAKEYARSSGYITHVKVVFDGHDRYRHMPGMNISQRGVQIFSRTGKGDDKIIETVKECSRRGRVVIASNDNYVRNNARAYGASLIFSQELIGKKQKDSEENDGCKKLNRKLRNEVTNEYKEELGL